ncbi:Sec-independent protein translocase subunit TatA [Streptomyces sp. NPDC001822]|uniref:Sec-independent protein translocase subunit TatA n=1 Tax=Streptomyces sp. NPDC001822 TaxID=3364614 RepID=UPI0036ADCD75
MLRNGLEPWHLLIVAIVVIALFASKRLPDTARAMGQSLRILKSEARAMKEDGASGTAAGPGETVRTPQPVIRSEGEPAQARTAQQGAAGAN